MVLGRIILFLSIVSLWIGCRCLWLSQQQYQWSTTSAAVETGSPWVRVGLIGGMVVGIGGLVVVCILLGGGLWHASPTLAIPGAVPAHPPMPAAPQGTLTPQQSLDDGMHTLNTLWIVLAPLIGLAGLLQVLRTIEGK